MPGSIQQKIKPQSETVSIQIVIIGYVQGVGFRPFVFRLAEELHIKGYVSNNTGQVTIAAEANKETLK